MLHVFLKIKINVPCDIEMEIVTLPIQRVYDPTVEHVKALRQRNGKGRAKPGRPQCDGKPQKKSEPKKL